MECGTKYCKASEKLVNFNKSSVLFSRNMALNVQGSLTDLMQVNQGENGQLSWGASKSILYGLLQEIMKSRHGIRSFYLLRERRYILRQLRRHFLYNECLQASQESKYEVDGYYEAIMVGRNEKSMGITWFSKGKLARRKDQGGLGFRDLETFNLVMLAKHAWIFLYNLIVYV